MLIKLLLPSLADISLVRFVLSEIPFDDDHRRGFVLRSRLYAGRSLSSFAALSLPGRQHQATRYRHNDDDVIQAHSGHVDQIYRQNFIPDLELKVRLKLLVRDYPSLSLHSVCEPF